MRDGKYKDPSIPVIRIIYIIASFLLGLLDMTLLYRAMHSLTGMANGMSMLVSFMVATAANFIALTWGWGNGRRMEEKSLNKKSIGEFFAWLAIGIMYAVIRVLNIVMHFNDEGFSWIGEVVQIAILAISYASTGILISSSAREIWDAESVSYRKAKRKFDAAHEELARNSAILNGSIGIMERYDLNYKSLDNQREKVSRAITKAEKATMADIVGKMVTKNPVISPAAANEVMTQVIKDNEEHSLS